MPCKQQVLSVLQRPSWRPSPGCRPQAANRNRNRDGKRKTRLIAPQIPIEIPEMQINEPTAHAEVTAAFARYEDALIHNKVQVMDELFWDSAHTIRYGAAENLYGIEQIRDFRNGRPAVALMRTLSKTVITTFGNDTATAMTEFRREGGNKLGRQSQTWCRIDGRWVVVAAHVSLMGLHP